ncbi:MAG TPA: FAD-binding oxidoreductase [Nocardioides sp.]|nr:FAD-binding oxidoreductase [Nocardioides sp.]
MIDDVSDVVMAPPYFRGEWIVPTDPGYDDGRQHFNHIFDRRPAVVARCDGVQDVRAALRVAREQGWEIAVRGGGRGPGGHSAIEGGLLLDLSLMNDVYVDADRRTARVGPGATQAEVLRETVPYGLAPITGLLSHIGFVGVAIYSGTGHLSPRHGYSCDWVLSAQVVLASGEVVTVSPTSHPDLFWALRGAGDNFGVVVSIETQLHAVPASATLATWSFPASDVRPFLHSYRALERTVSEDVFVVAGYSVGPGREATFDVVLAHLGDDVSVARDVALVDAFGVAVDRSVAELGWLDLHHALDEAYPSCRQYWAAADLKQLDDQTLELLADEPRRLADAPAAAELFIGFYTYRGAMLRQVASPPAAMNRRHGCELIAIAMYDDPADDAACERWADEMVARYRAADLVHPGAMPNYTTRVDLRATWGADYDRLAELKATYDPQNVFRSNCNIPPAERRQ